ncbi:cobalamin-binding protein [candidate division KSB1 bacterium]|nr:cobalamin-binding protein [candidate division KSB1 bacterium]NIV70805.1 cobalamin-binding protein [Phycisphaerae bacterium]NIR72923.1 cobalamin-binding protein [candidate division KSB1 bacterium]NIT73721.1 cobalamin-binding protein [candidate division KSB1 bacterium]NIU27593.1 cobalamin-binding protein [candidate division KSB1 bacterium]
MASYSELQQCVISGDKTRVKELTQAFLDNGKLPKEILDEGLIPGMAVVGKKFEACEFFIPEMLLSARALNAGLDLLKPLLEASDVKPIAKVLIGTVQGDIHDIGKNLVSAMLRGGGFEVIDAGVGVSPDQFVELAKETGVDIVGLSALLTTTMTAMKDTVQAFESDGSRNKIKIMIGGAPVTTKYAEEIGADGYARNASAAVEMAKKLIGAR